METNTVKAKPSPLLVHLAVAALGLGLGVWLVGTSIGTRLTVEFWNWLYSMFG